MWYTAEMHKFTQSVLASCNSEAFLPLDVLHFRFNHLVFYLVALLWQLLGKRMFKESTSVIKMKKNNWAIIMTHFWKTFFNSWYSCNFPFNPSEITCQQKTLTLETHFIVPCESFFSPTLVSYKYISVNHNVSKTCILPHAFVHHFVADLNLNLFFICLFCWQINRCLYHAYSLYNNIQNIFVKSNLAWRAISLHDYQQFYRVALWLNMHK